MPRPRRDYDGERASAQALYEGTIRHGEHLRTVKPPETPETRKEEEKRWARRAGRVRRHFDPSVLLRRYR